MMKSKVSLLMAVFTLVALVSLIGSQAAHAQSLLYGTSNTSSSLNTGTNSTGTSNRNIGSTSSAGNSRSSTTTVNSTTSPGVPNTGAGGEAPLNVALLAMAGIAAIGGLTYVARVAQY